MTRSGLRRAFTRATGGSSAVEFAILAPVFLMMMLGSVAYAIYFAAAHSIQQLTADAARVSVAGLDEAERNALVRRFIERNAADYILVDPERLGIEIGDKPGDPDQYQVVVSFDAGELPIWNLYLPLPVPSQTIRFISTIRKGG